MPQRQQQHPGPSFQAQLERKERRRSYVYRHQATISFFFTLAALVQSLGALIYLAVCRCYPVPHAPFLAGNIIYVVLWCVYVPFWLWSCRHAAYARREPSPQRWWRLYNPSDEPVEQQPRRTRERGPVGGHVDPHVPGETHAMVVRHPEPADLERGIQDWGLAVPKAKHE
ncbi:uncharacterized protein PG986_014654 [Apiospora aurea]|uniref:Uncharacterized protein n=1 Tax=Apiospora aurea TaxID=335848 RepID=A0ABR1PTK9_9PEZI